MSVVILIDSVVGDAIDAMGMECPEHALKIYKSNQDFKFLLVHPVRILLLLLLQKIVYFSKREFLISRIFLYFYFRKQVLKMW